LGEAWDLAHDDMSTEFLGLTKGCGVMETTVLATKTILGEVEKGNVKGYVGSREVKA